MSIQAVAWALEQDMPARPKLVLVSICNHADHRSGYCWLKAETIAEEASCSPRGVFNFVGDLIRNGYVRKSPKRGEDGRQRANDYWVVFDRAPLAWNAERGEEVEAEAEPDSVAEERTDAAISCEPHAPGACGENDAPDAPGAVGPHAHACRRIDSAEPSKTNPQVARARAGGFDAPPRRYRPPPPEPDIQGAVLDGREVKPVFVIEGTRAWEAWLAHKRATTGRPFTLTTAHVVDGKSRRGWWFPSLFPSNDAPVRSAESA